MIEKIDTSSLVAASEVTAERISTFLEVALSILKGVGEEVEHRHHVFNLEQIIMAHPYITLGVSVAGVFFVNYAIRSGALRRYSRAEAITVTALMTISPQPLAVGLGVFLRSGVHPVWVDPDSELVHAGAIISAVAIRAIVFPLSPVLGGVLLGAQLITLSEGAL